MNVVGTVGKLLDVLRVEDVVGVLEGVGDVIGTEGMKGVLLGVKDVEDVLDGVGTSWAWWRGVLTPGK